jgi:hypothetical protein
MHPQRVLGQFDSQGHIVGHLAILWEFACQRDMIAPAVGERQEDDYLMRSRKLTNKLRLNDTKALTPLERDLLALFRVMANPDRLLLFYTAKMLISAEAAQ